MIEEAKRLSFIEEYYFSRKLREVGVMVEEGKPVLNLGIGNPDLMPSEATIHQLQISAAKKDNHGYQPYKGIPSLREAMAAWYQRTYNVDIDPDREILPLIGSKEGINHICQAFLNPGDLALVPDPGYPSYNSAIRLSGADPVSYSLDKDNGWEPIWDLLKPSLLSKIKLWFIGYPNMPTGGAGNTALMSKVVELANTYKILVINDNPYSLVLNRNQPLSIHQAGGSKDVALELNSLSKSHNMAGWRVGMLSGKADYINSVLKVKSNIDSGMFRPIQEAAIEALNNSEEWHIERNGEFAARREIAYKILESLQCTYDKNQGRMFLWARIPDSYDKVEDLTEKLLHDVNVFITPGFIFGEGGKRYIRISLCSKQEQLEESLTRINNLAL